MNKRIRLLKKSLLFLIMILLVMLQLSCSAKDEYYVTWKDSDGSLLGYSTVDSDYDPSSRELPEDTNSWHYTAWNVNRSGNRIECTALRQKKSRIRWLDADGTLLKEENAVVSDDTVPSLALPKDTEQWHYTEWVKSVSTDGFDFRAERLEKIKYIWKDADGTVLNEGYYLEDQDEPSFDLPEENEKWDYIEWDSKVEDGVHIHTAKRLPNPAYFSGNVFQIVIKDADGTPLGTGSGFVINDEGWFITNNHVMEEASSAIAFFDIKDKSSGNRYTQLNILGGVYNSSEKDIFIGKLEDYQKISEHYKEIRFTEEYTQGETSYTVGYPNSSVKMEINSGVILEEYSDIFDKINGIYYVLSDSYIAPGSSGGILMNANFEVIGITTIGLYADDNKQVYKAGGSVPTLVFSAHLNDLDENKIKKITDIYK